MDPYDGEHKAILVISFNLLRYLVATVTSDPIDKTHYHWFKPALTTKATDDSKILLKELKPKCSYVDYATESIRIVVTSGKLPYVVLGHEPMRVVIQDYYSVNYDESLLESDPLRVPPREMYEKMCVSHREVLLELDRLIDNGLSSAVSQLTDDMERLKEALCAEY